ncbi:MAG: hypothetical protein HOZ81_40240 [Streptomyces sp.]|nr:hypothetical protein [Streptomyces sp.]
MTAIMLADGVLRVPVPMTLPDGTRIDAARDIAPGDPDYDAWLRFATLEEPAWHGAPEDEAILARWRTAASA